MTQKASKTVKIGGKGVKGDEVWSTHFDRKKEWRRMIGTIGTAKKVQEHDNDTKITSKSELSW